MRVESERGRKSLTIERLWCREYEKQEGEEGRGKTEKTRESKEPQQISSHIYKIYFMLES